VQVSSIKATVKVDARLLARVEEILKAEGIAHQGLFADQNSVRAASATPKRRSRPRTPSSAPSTPMPRMPPTWWR
jgi:hypothetical protein